MYRNNVNINDLINRFQATNDDMDMPENVKTSLLRKYSRMQDENFGNDENRSLVKAFSNNDKFIDNTVYVRRTNVSISGAKEFIKQLLHRISALLEMISKFPFPRMSVVSFGISALLSVFLAPKAFTEKVLYPGFKIIFTIIYPAYRSFKAVRNKNLKEYLKWLVYWIVYAFFSCFELITDALLNWFPFYYEIKVIFLIWLLGPSSRGSMKIYKNVIHPILVSREQDIDDVIQLAQEHGYMQVFRLSSKSVNYANKIIMQDAKTDANFVVSHQLMKNISLSNLSDAGTMQSSDNDDILQMRRYSIEQMPFYSNNQVNYAFENLDSRRKPSFDYNYDDMMSSGYSSPVSTYNRFPIRQHHQKGAFIEDEIKSDLKSQKFTVPENNQIFKTSTNEPTDDEIVLAYQRLQMDKSLEKSTEAIEDIKNDDSYIEFLKWQEMKKNDVAIMSKIKEEKPVPQAVASNQSDEKVKTKNDDFNVANCLDEKSVEKPNVSGVFDVDVDAKLSTNVQELELPSELNQLPAEESLTSEFLDVENEKTENDQDVDFSEFKDVIESGSDTENDLLNVPLIIKEESDLMEPTAATNVENHSKAINEVEMATAVDEVIISSRTEIDSNNTVDAKLTLTNEPLEIVTHLSASSISLASSLDGSENKIKRPAKHLKGRAPQPPVIASASNVIEGYFYDELTKKHFKETEL